MSRYLSLLISILTFVSVTHAGEAHVSFDTNVKVTTLSKTGQNEEASYDSGKDVPLKSDTLYWVSAHGRVPVLIVPQSPADQEAPSKLVLPDVALWPSDVAEKQLQSKLTSVIEDLYQFQNAIARKDTAEAEKVLNRMESVQPMDYYSFLRASLAFVKGDMKTARDQVQRGLKRYPANEQGSRLLKSIEGATR